MGNQTVQTEEKVWSPEACKAAAEELRNSHPSDILAWAVQQFGPSDLTLACSFGYEDVALVDMLVKLNPDVDIFYLDTGLLFRETYETRDRLAERYQRISSASPQILRWNNRRGSGGISYGHAIPTSVVTFGKWHRLKSS